MLKNLCVATHNVQARLDILASWAYATTHKTHLLHITEPFPQHRPPNT